MATRTVLIADADRDSREISASILRHAGYRTLEVADGESLLRKALAHRPAAILMELRLPGVDGHAALARPRGRTRTAQIPTLVLTARTAAADRDRAHRLGCDAYLIKPYRPRWLLAEVQWVLSRRGRSLISVQCQWRGWRSGELSSVRTCVFPVDRRVGHGSTSAETRSCRRCQDPEAAPTSYL